MPSPQVQRFTLTPHPATKARAVHRIEGRISRTGGVLLVSYVLERDMERLRVPERRTPGFADELWRRTCFELFIALPGEDRYHEFNFSPSGEWSAYAFARYREPAPFGSGAELTASDPRIIVSRSSGELGLNAVVQLARLSPGHADAGLALGLTAVIETHDDLRDSLSYWALEHPPGKPDFHHRDTFALELDEIRT